MAAEKRVAEDISEAGREVRARTSGEDEDGVLVTGTTGWIGKALAVALVEKGEKVVGLSRRSCDVPGVVNMQADLATGAGLEELKGMKFKACVHLAAAAGWCSLEQGLEINVQGTRRLLDAVAPLGCKRFILASSISAIGTGIPDDPPVHLPIPDEHPYVGHPWPYALSKINVEQLARFIAAKDKIEQTDPLQRLEFMLMRIGCCITDPPGVPRHLETAIDGKYEIKPSSLESPPVTSFPTGGVSFPEAPLTAIAISDMVRCLSLAVAAPHRPGVRTFNITGLKSFLAEGVTVPQIMKHWYGDAIAQVDFSHYEVPGHERDAIFDNTAIQKELGFFPQVDMFSAYTKE